MTTDLIKSVSLDNLMAHRAALEEKLQAAYDALVEAEGILDSIKDNVLRSSDVTEKEDEKPYYIGIRIRDLFAEYNSSKRVNFMDGGNEGVRKALKQIDQRLWDALFRESGMQSFMDAQARRQWDEALSNGDFLPLTPEAIKATFAGLYEQREDFFDRGVVNVFRKLSWQYKSNSPIKFGRRLIMEYLHTQYSGGWLSLSHNKCAEIDDLNRVFHLLDGLPEPDVRDGIYAQLGAIRSQDNAPGEIETPYFRLKWFKNGNGHLYFHRPDIVDELNRIVAKHHPNAIAPSPKDAWNERARAEARQHAHVNAKADFFPTPREVGEQLLAGVGFSDATDLVLEPSAGEGALAEIVRDCFAGPLDLIEKDSARVVELRRRGFDSVRHADFLHVTPEPVYSHVVMNPPFSGGQDVDHVMHAWDFLRPGGQLLAIVGVGSLSRGRFRDFLHRHGAEVEELPAGAFKESGTMVRAALLRLRKPRALAVSQDERQTA